MDIKLLFQILTPLSVGGSIIGLFGDFGDGWVTVSQKSGEALEFGGVHLYERNPHMFGLKDGNQRWNQAEVGKTYYDYYYKGITDLETFSTEPGNGKRNLLINGFGLQVQSKTGGVISGREGETLTVSDLRESSLGMATAKGGVREIKVEVKRVGISSSEDGKVDKVMSLDDMCVVSVGDYSDVFLIFSGVKMGPSQQIWYPNQNERFIGLNGCIFFGSIGKEEELWLTKVKIGSGAKGDAFVLASGQNGNPKGILGWSKGGSSIFKQGLKDGQFGAVALIGVVGNLHGFLHDQGCYASSQANNQGCEKIKNALMKNEHKSYVEGKGECANAGKIGGEGGKKCRLVKEGSSNPVNGKKEGNIGKGWLGLRNAALKETIGIKRGKDFGTWMKDVLSNHGWNLRKGLEQGWYMPLKKSNIVDEQGRFKKEFAKQIRLVGQGANGIYEWKKTAVMR